MKIGLALGAGAARGWAHIGVIRALQRAGIQIDVIAGCSIGAYVGAAYASGKLDELEAWANTLTEWQVFRLLGVGFKRGGLASGQKVFDKLKDEFCAERFDEMNIPFACVSTDLYSGKEVVFNQGELGDSIQASCAIPALFSPVHHQGRWLVDGAVVNPVPVNQCRQLGADFVIAVNLSADFRPRLIETCEKEHEENQKRTDDLLDRASEGFMKKWFSPEPKPNKATPPGIVSVMSSSLEILQARVTRSRLAGEPPDILIEPQLRDVGILEFHRAIEVAEKGSQAVERLSEQLLYQLGMDKVAAGLKEKH
ncbi:MULTISPECIES: patatin-like phospholipase RssA [Alteromonadaceae]|uniref:Patatin-like phospholipase RssA n=1 Tax=Brumicola blandensis TaxID=3075611 RepID=A0AAW8QWB4_9ALTE|nr:MULTISPECIES: patatin-like phospholipase RssA [unclassified Alteromonas]MDT0581448.1 patatin-like phospholipase RssA [Alteromonas sp. W409]MDT0627066.1 patatin-like phospholipase RssA [Alteromonas sp. W364]